jgi:5-methylcytosine-specific restriction endonuclease McrA
MMGYKKKNRWKSPGEKVRYMTWRKIVFETNKGLYGLSKHYVCMKCKKKLKTTRAMHAHHEFSWQKFPKKRYERKNGVVMCIKCHKAFHKKYKFKALDDPECLTEYLNSK